MAATDQMFWNAYERLSQEGHCDSPGGIEYCRVFEEWVQFGRPTEIEQFIRTRANMLAGGSTPHFKFN